MKVGSAEREPGKVTTGYIHTAWLADENEVRVPVMIAAGVQDGPVLWINAGVHGQEISGIFAIQKLFSSMNLNKIKGTIVATPGCNPLGLKGHNKFTPEDQLDLDQQFPGRERGWLSEQMAYHFFNEVRGTADYLLDLHALGGVDAAPYTVFKTTAGVSSEFNKTITEIALLMGAPFNCHVDLSTATGELPGALLGALDIQCILNGIPALMVEMGAGNRIVWENVDRVVKGINNVMCYLEMQDGTVEWAQRQKIITKRDFPTNVRGGLVLPYCLPGGILKKGDPIARVVDHFGATLEQIDADRDCIVVGVLEDPVANAGTVVAVIGQEWHEAGAR